MIVTFTPNPALDKTVVVPGFALGKIFRTADVQTLAGGKGFNVARSLRVLGADPLIVAPLAGHTGRLIDDLAQAEGLRCDHLWFDGETRTCLSIVDPTSGTVSEVYETGPILPPATWDRTLAVLRQRLVRGNTLMVSGGFPPGVPDDALKQIAECAHEVGVLTMFDTYGPQLRRALAAHPRLVKCNAHEAGDLLERPVEGVEQALYVAADIRALGAQSVVVTLGALGAVGVDEHGEPFAWQAPNVLSISAVGSGDACFAGIVLGLTAGESLPEATRRGVAAGAANTLSIGAGMFDRSEAERLIGVTFTLAHKAQ
jgi:1-phosphofructokinase family hexose kinase